MNKSRITLIILGITAFSNILLASHAHAGLGGGLDSIESDRSALSAVKRSPVSQGSYTVYTLDAPSTSLREYVSSSGVVFAIAWKGNHHPALDQLLGTYLGEYQDSEAQTPRKLGRRSHIVKTSRIVVEKSGHMRALRGCAYDPSLIPAGVSIHEIQ